MLFQAQNCRFRVIHATIRPKSFSNSWRSGPTPWNQTHRIEIFAPHSHFTTDDLFNVRNNTFCRSFSTFYGHLPNFSAQLFRQNPKVQPNNISPNPVRKRCNKGTMAKKLMSDSHISWSIGQNWLKFRSRMIGNCFCFDIFWLPEPTRQGNWDLHVHLSILELWCRKAKSSCDRSLEWKSSLYFCFNETYHQVINWTYVLAIPG